MLVSLVDVISRWLHGTVHEGNIHGRGGENGGGRVGRRLRGGNGTRIDVQVLKISTEVWRRRAIHGHGSIGVLLLNLDWFGGLAVLSFQLVLKLSKRHAKHGLQVTDEAIHVPLAWHLVNDVLVIVVAKASAQLLVVHFRLVLSGPPSSSDLFRVNEFELPLTASP